MCPGGEDIPSHTGCTLLLTAQAPYEVMLLEEARGEMIGPECHAQYATL